MSQRLIQNYKAKRCLQISILLLLLLFSIILLSYNNNYLMANHSEERNVISPILALSCEEQGQITLQWNFHGVRNTKIQTSNLFVFRNTRQEEAQEFIEEFYSQSSLGDIIGVVNLADNKIVKSINWIEKSAFRLETIIQEKNLDCIDFLKNLQNILPKFINRRGLNLINFYDPAFGEKAVLKQKEFLQNYFSSWKKQNQCRGTVVLNLLGNNLGINELNMQKGVNFFTKNSRSNSEICSTMKKYQNSLRLSKVSLRLKLLSDNFYVGKSKNNGWINSDFNILEKTVFNAPSLQFQEKLFLCSNYTLRGQKESVACKLELSLLFLDGDQCQTEREVLLQPYNIKDMNVSLRTPLEFEQVQIWKGETMRISFLEREHFLYLKKAKQSGKRSYY